MFYLAILSKVVRQHVSEMLFFRIISVASSRSSRPWVFCKKAVLKITGKLAGHRKTAVVDSCSSKVTDWSRATFNEKEFHHVLYMNFPKHFPMSFSTKHAVTLAPVLLLVNFQIPSKSTFFAIFFLPLFVTSFP